MVEPSFTDKTDFENASKGFIATLDAPLIHSNNRPIWNTNAYDFLNAECPSTANPKLWRLAQVTSIHGLFKVTDGVYQVRGLDLANMTIVEGKEGIIVIDPLTSAECASSALELYRKHCGNRPVKAVMYSHSHIDHFGGAKGVLELTEDIPIVAPEGFTEEATSENIYVGNAMQRRAMYMYGTRLPKSSEGPLGCAIGMGVSMGSSSLVPPNTHITATGQEMVVDDVKFVFQMVPDSEAPAEMNFYLPERKALYIAECATHGLHNIITLRGAQVRDAKAWAKYLDESLVLFGEEAEVLFAGHQWPTWGREEISTFISQQRDLYAYLHDQTVRMMNTGMTGIEIADILTLPPALQKAWHTQGFYGSVSHNVKGVYQRYMGWFDGNPAHLWEYPPVESARRYVDCMGGIEEVVTKAEKYAEGGDLRFAATLLGHAVALDANHERAKMRLASVFERLGYGAENATWRNFYLSGAQDLRLGPFVPPPGQIKLANRLNPQQSVDQWFSILSVRMNGPKAAEESFAIDIHVLDEEKWWRLIVSNGVLTHRSASDRKDLVGKAELSLEMSKKELGGILNGDIDSDREGWELLLKLLSFVS
ncbi:hypothetical protein ASPWEDRAFT_49919 [Aspergillus wentii DTO 134E9]|uniref:Metallo-beta-lactamase domain-containing protein n=1 Tax=Aspergillus wentii DTO 134E9 TaxID=1073089 RepID=A0A1L9RN97_ASPWE|nr:uncharacterized protein ASPWEDRAFT_49919 [Aspergillus wentii DTO 134E9]OJJ36429.1 hypothetical protein ASPWEDRAFT_49919 [Aspergillus wentii DTO 134E9]